jgi:hypothetical protein
MSELVHNLAAWIQMSSRANDTPTIVDGRRGSVEHALFELIVDAADLDHFADELRFRRSKGEIPRFAEPLSPDQTQAVLEQGFIKLDDRELATLTMNPIALEFLHNALMNWGVTNLDWYLADEWLAALEGAARREAENHGAHLDIKRIFRRGQGTNTSDSSIVSQEGETRPSESHAIVGDTDVTTASHERKLAGSEVGVELDSLVSFGRDASRPPAVSSDRPLRWEVQASLTNAHWKSQDDPARAEQGLESTVEVEYAWRLETAGPVLELVFLGGPIRMGLIGASLTAWLCGPNDEPRIEGTADRFKIRFALPKFTKLDDLAGWMTESEFRWEGKYHLLLRIPIRRE